MGYILFYFSGLNFFRFSDAGTYMKTYIQTAPVLPMILSSKAGFLWSAAFTCDRKTLHIHIMGPMYVNGDARNSIILFNGLCSRAAIDGGLPAEISYNLCDMYTSLIEKDTTMTELMRISHTMYDDYVHRVHNYHQAEPLSSPVRFCCDYIRMHVENDISLPLLSSKQVIRNTVCPDVLKPKPEYLCPNILQKKKQTTPNIC